MAWSRAERRRLTTQIVAALIQRGVLHKTDEQQEELVVLGTGIVERIAWRVELMSDDMDSENDTDESHGDPWPPGEGQRCANCWCRSFDVTSDHPLCVGCNSGRDA